MIPPPPGRERASGSWTIRVPGDLGVVDTVEVGFAVWARHWKQLGILSLALGGWVAVVISLTDPGPGLRDVLEMVRTGVVPEDLASAEPSRISQALSLLSGFVLGPILVMATMRIVLGSPVGSAPTSRSAVMYGLRRIASTWWLFLSLMLASLAVGIGVFVVAVIAEAIARPLALVVLVPIVYLAVRVVGTWLGAFVVDDARGFRAIGRAWELTTGRWWPTAGVLLLVALITVALALVGLVIQLLVPGSGDLTAVIQAVIGALVNATLGPIGYAVVAVLYLDLLARRESADPAAIQTRIERHDPT